MCARSATARRSEPRKKGHAMRRCNTPTPQCDIGLRHCAKRARPLQCTPCGSSSSPPQPATHSAAQPFWLRARCVRVRRAP